MPDSTWINQYGPYGAFILYFLLQKLWPFIEKRVWPDMVAARRQTQAADAQLLDRIFKAFENNTTAMTGLQVTLGTVNEQQRELVSAVRELNEDVAGLYGSIQKPRPSRVKATPDAR